jgi:Cd2+/Zn2+-exporting ATPase
MFVFLKKYDMMMQERVMILEKKTFEISNIQSVEELNHLSLKLNEQEQVSHMKISKESIVFNCIDIDALLSLIQGVNKEHIVKEVIDGSKRQYDFAQRKEVPHYFMFKNMVTEDDIYVLINQIQEDSKYHDIEYDPKNKILTLVSSQRDVLSYLRKELFKINPSIEIMEHRKPIRSQDVFNQKREKL